MYRIIDSNLTTPFRSGNVVAYYPSIYIFSMDEYLIANDPIPVSFKGEYMRYSGQRTFRLSDNTTYSPVKELMDRGTVSSKNGKITVAYEEEYYTLDSKMEKPNVLPN